MMEKMFFIIDTNKEKVYQQDLSHYKVIMDSFFNHPQDHYGSLILLFGFDDDEREIYEIPEIRAYVKKLQETYPSIWCFISPEDSPGIYPSVCNDFSAIKVKDKISISIAPNEIKGFFENLLIQLTKLEKSTATMEHPLVKAWLKSFDL